MPDETLNTSSEYQIPSASDDLSTAPSADAANGASEFQVPSASEELVPEADAATGASEFQLPDASSAFGGSALVVGDTSTTTNEYQAAQAVDILTPSMSHEPATGSSGDPPVVAPGFDAEDDTEPGEWVTWSDAALAAEAEPFEADPEPAAPSGSLAITEIMEIVSLAGNPSEAVVSDTFVVTETLDVVDIADITETMEVPEPLESSVQSLELLFRKSLLLMVLPVEALWT